MKHILDKTSVCMRDLRDLSFPELDELRRGLNLKKRELCRAADVSEGLYWRWTQWAQGDNRGCQPGRRSLDAVRRALLDQLTQRIASSPGTCVGTAVVARS